MDGYSRFTRKYRSVSGSLIINNTPTPTTLVAAKNPYYTIYVQYVNVHVNATGFDGSFWSLRDSVGNLLTDPLQTDHSPQTPGGPYNYTLDFGPDGFPLTAGADFVFDGTMSGATGSLTWQAYMKPNTTLALSTITE